MSLIMTSTSCSHSIGESIVAVFNTVHSLAQSKMRKRLDLRFAYVYLKRVVNALNVVTEASYINIYLYSKEHSLDILSSQLSDYTRRGKCWSMLASPSPFQLSVYSRLAETIVYVLPTSFVMPLILKY